MRVGNIGHAQTVALRKLGHPNNFEFYRFQCIEPDGLILTGCVSSGLATKGKRKGRPRYDGKPQTTVVLESEESQEFARFEREEGKCGECMGEGWVFASWNYLTGTAHRECRRCAGTKMAPTS